MPKTFSREAVIAHIAAFPHQANKRDLAKVFALKGADRIPLKHLIKELQSEGLFETVKPAPKKANDMPSVMVLEITTRDRDGGLLARPDTWESDELPPRIEVRIPRGGKKPITPPGIGDRVLAKLFPHEGGYQASVIKKLEKSIGVIIGVLRGTAKTGFVIEPTDRKQSEYSVQPQDLGDAKSGDLVEARPVGHKRHSQNARIETVVGPMDGEKAVSLIAIYSHGIPHEFPAEVIAESETASLNITKHYEDWRDQPLITIDPATAKDHDDAVMAVADPNPKNEGGWIVTVAIADVAAYIKPGSAMDKEAAMRGNSVYFPDRVVPMLPERISNDLCSLREHEDRPSLAVRMTFTPEGRKLHHSFHRILMRSHAKLSYEQAQAAIDGRTDAITAPLLENVLKPLWDAYASMKIGRDSRAPLELDLPERKLILDENGAVLRVEIPPRLDAHKLIEECMIQANVCAAETVEAKKEPVIYRVHDGPTLSKQEALRDFLKTVGHSLARGPALRPAALNQILFAVADSDDKELVNQVVLQSQSQAIYDVQNIGHFGLNLKKYAHFTSPIRRYADLTVHRALIDSLGLGADGPTADVEELARIAAHISTTERRAMMAERDTVDRLVAYHLAGKVGLIVQGKIGGINKAGLFVRLPDYGSDGFIPLRALGHEYFHIDEASRSVIGEKSGKGFRMADLVDVKILESQPLSGSVTLEMISPPRPLPSGTISFRKHKSQQKRASHSSRGKLRKAGKGKRG